jgi:Na+/melibiose symporter-like transporter
MGDTQRDESGKHMPQHHACNASSTELSFPNFVPDATEVPAGDLAIVHNSSSPHSKTHSVISDLTIQAKDMHQETCQRRVQVPSSTTTEFQELEVDSRSRPSLSTLLAFIALCLAIFLVALDTVLIPTALPTIALSFQVSDSLYAWIGSAYLLANAASVPFWGKVSDIFGRKAVILAAEIIFLVGSMICALSSNAVMLIAGRAVQGFGGGGVVVLVHVCVSDLFSIRYVLALPILL